MAGPVGLSALVGLFFFFFFFLGGGGEVSVFGVLRLLFGLKVSLRLRL